MTAHRIEEIVRPVLVALNLNPDGFALDPDWPSERPDGRPGCRRSLCLVDLPCRRPSARQGRTAHKPQSCARPQRRMIVARRTEEIRLRRGL